MRAVRTVLLTLLVLAACGDDAGTTTTTTATTAPTTTTAAEATTTSAVASAPANILAVVSGRGDDGSLEVAVWFEDDPFPSGATVIVGIDSDESYPGSGDVVAHLDGFMLLASNGPSVEVTVSAAGEVVAAPGIGVTDRWVSWGFDGTVLRVFFVEDVATRSGSVWVIARVGDTTAPLGIAGVPLGEQCSHEGSGVAVTLPPEGVPDAGRTCSYR